MERMAYSISYTAWASDRTSQAPSQCTVRAQNERLLIFLEARFTVPLQVDFLPAQALTPEDLEKQRLALEARSRSLRNVVTMVDGNQANFEIMIDNTYT